MLYIISRDVTRLVPGAQPPKERRSRQTGTVIGLFCTAVFDIICCCRLIEDYLFVVFCVVDMIVINLSTTYNQ